MSKRSKIDDGYLPAHTEQVCDALDAAFFSGDTFYNRQALTRIEFYLARWERELPNIRKIVRKLEKA